MQREEASRFPLGPRVSLADDQAVNEDAKIEEKVEGTIADDASSSSDAGGDGLAQDDPLARLPEHERHILQRQIELPAVQVTYLTLFRYATANDKLIIGLAAFCALAGGALLPLMTVLFGQLTGVFNGYFLGTLSYAQFQHELGSYTLYFLYLAIATFVTIYVATAGFLYTGEHITQKIRQHYLAAVLRQNIAFFDLIGAGEITTRITADMNLIQESISEKVALILTGVSTFVAAFVIGLARYWRLTLILCAGLITLNLVMGFGGRYMIKFLKLSIFSYAAGGSVAEEVLCSIKNATAFSTQEKLARLYDRHLDLAEKWGFRQKAVQGCMLGGMMFVINLMYGLAFWQGSRYLVAGGHGVTLSETTTIIFAIVIGAFALGGVAPHVSSLSAGVAAAMKIFATIDRSSPLDPTSTNGIHLEHVEGAVELRNVRHIYPSRPEVVVLDNVSIYIPPGKTTAFVGASGSGKSTVVGLIERFYDPVGGQILIDGHDISDLNLHALRRHISLVSQEPTLFGTTIRANIAHGLIGTEYENAGDEKIQDMVIDAAKIANAHNFISSLPEKYETNVGGRGFLLSGGQKQRIAIARALISNPKILLLDEATSALDTKSEVVVQAALDAAAQGRTTISIAHRLSTIKNSSNIVVFSGGQVVEQGTHEELLAAKSTYYGLVEAQRIAAAQRAPEEEEKEAEEAELGDEARVLHPMPSRRQSSRRGVSLKRGDSYTRATLNRLGSYLKPALTRSESSKSGSKRPVAPTRTDTTNSVSLAVLNDMADEPEEYSLWTLLKLVGSFNRQEWHVMLIGLVSSVIAGGGQPVGSLLVSKCIVSLSLPSYEYVEMRLQIDFWAGMYLMLAFVMLIAYSVQGFAFAHCSERLIHRSRGESFRRILRQDINFFDKEENSAGALTSFLSTETTHLAGLSGGTLGTILSVTTTLVVAFTLALSIGWKLALVCISTVPILLVCGFLRFWILVKFQTRLWKVYADSASYACEATSAIRTVASLGRERDVLEGYNQQLTAQGRRSLISVLKSSLLYAASQSLVLLCDALAFWYGGILIAKGEYNMEQFFITFTSILFGAQAAGTVFSFIPDIGKAKLAALHVKQLFERVPAIDIWSKEGEFVGNTKGALEFREVHFRYPSRPKQPVLRGLSFRVEPSQYVALVGASGCGKSTTIGLLERFYDPLTGSIVLDGRDIKTLNLKSYRSHIALVSQEPTLYQGTIRDNILLGVDDAHIDDIPAEDLDERIESACREANIATFISSLPEGFDTPVGAKGVMLSGGQKQRIAIARALFRNPRVLLLDEATSALDSESERVVQEALDKAAKGRTTVAIAHRLSTVQKADRIFLVESGKVVEAGTHAELMGMRGGRYAELAMMQGLEALSEGNGG